MAKSSSFLPRASSAESHLGGMPRPAQVWEVSAGLRYFGGTLVPLALDLRLLADFFASQRGA